MTVRCLSVAALFYGAVVMAAPGASAATVTAGSFVAEATEDFEGTPGSRTVLPSVFGGDVTIGGGTSFASVDQGDWFDFRGSGAVAPTSGSRFGVIFGIGTVELDFTGIGGIFGFGGFATAAGAGDDVIEFLDLGGNSIFTFTETGGFGPGDGTMAAFSFISDMAIGTVRLTGTETAFDDLAYTTEVAGR